MYKPITQIIMNKAEELKETGLTKEQQVELHELKIIRNKRGFFTPDESKRYNELFHLHAKAFICKMKAIEEANRIVISN